MNYLYVQNETFDNAMMYSTDSGRTVAMMYSPDQDDFRTNYGPDSGLYNDSIFIQY